MLHPAICTYLPVGLSFATLYVVLDRVHPPAPAADPATLGHAQLTAADVVFLGGMTLTTVGYGEISPVSAEASLVALFEAVVRVFFLAFLVACLSPGAVRRKSQATRPWQGRAGTRVPRVLLVSGHNASGHMRCYRTVLPVGPFSRRRPR
jgi:Ion channel